MSQRSGRDNEQTVDLSVVEESVGEVPKEMSPEAKARLNLAYWVLGGVAALFVFSGCSVLYAPAERLSHASEMFEFAKTFGPPIVTLVLGFYFRSEAS